MPTFNGNSPFLSINGISVATPFVDVKMSGKNKTVDTTAGTGVNDLQRSPGLNEYDYKITLAYLAGTVSTYIQQLKPGSNYNIEYGPEGAVSGKPRHVQNVIVETADLSGQSASKDRIEFALSAVSNGAPSVDMYSGGVYP